MRAQLERFLDFTPGPAARRSCSTTASGWRGTGCSTSCARSASTSRSRHAGEGLRPAAHGRRACRSPSSATDAPGDRLPAPPPRSRRRPADGRLGPVGQHHGRAGADPPRRGAGGGRRAERLRAVQPAARSPSGPEDGQDGEGAVFLAAHRTSPYDFYQYWLGADDRDIGSYLRWLTLLRSRRGRGARRRAGGASRARARAAGVRLRPHRAHPRPGGGRAPAAGERSGVLRRAAHGPGHPAGPPRRRGRVRDRTGRDHRVRRGAGQRAVRLEGGPAALDCAGRRDRGRDARRRRGDDPSRAPMAGYYHVVRHGRRRLAVGRLRS